MFPKYSALKPVKEVKKQTPRKNLPYDGNRFVRIGDWLSYARTHKLSKVLLEWTVENDPEITAAVGKNMATVLGQAVGIDTVTLLGLALARVDELWAVYCTNVTIVVHPTLTNDLASEITRRFTHLTDMLRRFFNLHIGDDNGRLVCSFLTQHAIFSDPIPPDNKLLFSLI